MEHTTLRTTLCGALAATLAYGVTAGTEQPPTKESPMSMVTINTEDDPNARFLIDSFSVPDTARQEFEAAMHRNMAFIRTRPGFRGHVAFERAGGPTTFNIVTIAVWESQEALNSAAEQVRAHYRAIGFDMPAMLARWGVRVERGQFTAPHALQE